VAPTSFPGTLVLLSRPAYGSCSNSVLPKLQIDTSVGQSTHIGHRNCPSCCTLAKVLISHILGSILADLNLARPQSWLFTERGTCVP
jgi:hypothetical protein